jgi:hypothetical protein
MVGAILSVGLSRSAQDLMVGLSLMEMSTDRKGLFVASSLGALRNGRDCGASKIAQMHAVPQAPRRVRWQQRPLFRGAGATEMSPECLELIPYVWRFYPEKSAVSRSTIGPSTAVPRVSGVAGLGAAWYL